MKAPLTPMHFGFSTNWCAKICYSTRKRARKAASLIRTEHLSPYRCPDDPTHFHLGHLAPAIIEGRTTRKNLYRRNESTAQG